MAVRQQILEAAQALVARQGIHATTMDDIVRGSRLSKGAIYGHFASKEELLLALQDRNLETRIRQVTDRFRPNWSVRARLHALLSAALVASATADRDRSRLNIEFLAVALRTRPLRARVDARYSRSHELFRALLREGQQTGELRRDLDASVAASAILAFLDGIALHRALTTSVPGDSRPLLRGVERLFFGGLLPARSRVGFPARAGSSGRQP
jgi:AcrR family transcriptional regulator